MDQIQKLTQYFSDLPGIGPRQAKRFVYFLLTRDREYLREFSTLIQGVKDAIEVCQCCFRFFPRKNTSKLCSICSNPSRDQSSLLIVSRDVDLENIEKTGMYTGLYFVLGGTVPILEKDPEHRVRIKDLLARLKHDENSHTIKEIILATSANPEGENTADYVQSMIRPFAENIKVSILGRGLSTGTELEYSDAETLRNALKNRS